MAADAEISLEARLRDIVTTQLTKMEARLGTFGTRARQAMGKMQKATASAKAGLIDFAKRFGPAAIAGALLFGAMRKVGAAIDFVREKSVEFEKTLSKVKAILVPTTVEFERLANKARLLGETTAFSATQAGEAFVELGKLGLNTNQIIAASADVLNLAAAASTSMENAAINTARTLGQFGLRAEEAQRVTDVMAKSFNISALDIDKFSESMKFVGPTAASLNVSLEATTAALAQLASQGIVGSQAGTAFRRILLELGDSGSKAAKMIGFAVKSSEDFTRALGVLQSKNLSPGAIKDTFGLLSSTSAGILIKGTENVKDFEIALNEAERTAKQMADTMLDNVAGATQLLTSAQEGLALAIGETFGENKRERIDFYAETVRFATSFVREHSEALSVLGKILQTVILVPIKAVIAVFQGWVAIMEVGIGSLLKMAQGAIKAAIGVKTFVAALAFSKADVTDLTRLADAFGEDAAAAFERAREAAEGLQMGKPIRDDITQTTEAVKTAGVEMGETMDILTEQVEKFKFLSNSGFTGPQTPRVTQIGGDPEAQRQALRDAFTEKQKHELDIQELTLQAQEDTLERSIALEQLRLARQLNDFQLNNEFREKATAVSEKNIAKIREDFTKQVADSQQKAAQEEIALLTQRLAIANAFLGVATALASSNEALIPILRTIKALEIAIAAARSISAAATPGGALVAGLGAAAGLISLFSASSGGRVPGSPGQPRLIMAHG